MKRSFAIPLLVIGTLFTLALLIWHVNYDSLPPPRSLSVGEIKELMTYAPLQIDERSVPEVVMSRVLLEIERELPDSSDTLRGYCLIKYEDILPLCQAVNGVSTSTRRNSVSLSYLAADGREIRVTYVGEELMKMVLRDRAQDTLWVYNLSTGESEYCPSFSQRY